MDEKIKDVQNTLWLAYRTFGEDGSIPHWQNTVVELKKKYVDDSDINNFIDNLALAWTPIINKMKVWSV